jgi:CDP-diacylglycerol---serine O-phosphatidyltransferase
MDPVLPRLETQERRRRGRLLFRHNRIPLRLLVPNFFTVLSLCAGLTAIRMAIEQRFDLAIALVVIAALLDGIDGRLARALKAQSKFGAELDSLADFVNFGVAPGLILYFWKLNELANVGWIAAMVFAISASLRLARFNVAIDDPNKPAYAENFFTGVPAPAGALCVLLPIYLALLGAPEISAGIIVFYVLAIAFLMVSRLPVFSGKKFGVRVPREMVLPVIVLVIFVIALLIAYPWPVLSAGTILFLGSLPLGWRSYREYERRAAEVTVAANTASVRPAPFTPPAEATQDERPQRLN